MTNALLVAHVIRLQHAQTHKDLLHANVTLVLLEMEQHVQVHTKYLLKNKKEMTTAKLIEVHKDQHNKYIRLIIFATYYIDFDVVFIEYGVELVVWGEVLLDKV